jgi:hypothetical protein
MGDNADCEWILEADAGGRCRIRLSGDEEEVLWCRPRCNGRGDAERSLLRYQGTRPASVLPDDVVEGDAECSLFR